MEKIFRLIFLFTLFFASAAYANTVTQTARISFEIEPVTAVSVASESGVQAVRMGPVAPHAEVTTQSLKVSIKTNTKQHYRVYQNFEGEMLNSAGTPFPLQKILFRASNGEKSGVSEVASPTQLTPGEIPIFTSSSEGGADAFHIYFVLDNTELFPAGLFYGNLNIDLRVE